MTPSPTFPILPTEGKAFANAMVPRYAPAECSPRCDDPQCHYAHSDSWWVGKNGPFGTREEALRAIGEPDPRERDAIDIGGDIQEAALRILAAGRTLMDGPLPQAIADARAALRTITEQLDWMEGRNV